MLCTGGGNLDGDRLLGVGFPADNILGRLSCRALEDLGGNLLMFEDGGGVVDPRRVIEDNACFAESGR